MEGYLLVDKPTTWTSFDVVNFVRSKAAQALGVKPNSLKVGHSGTLDPFASGLLIVLVGKSYTAKASNLVGLDKTYLLVAVLGARSETGDPESEIIRLSNLKPSLKQIDAGLKQLTGRQMQTPPKYSALKISGQPAYKLARAGKLVDLKPRPVNIYSLKLVSYKYPNLALQARVSSGTYIRSLVEDLGGHLGTSAYTSQLKRTQIGKYSLKQAIPASDINEQNISSLLKRIA